MSIRQPTFVGLGLCKLACQARAVAEPRYADIMEANAVSPDCARNTIGRPR